MRVSNFSLACFWLTLFIPQYSWVLWFQTYIGDANIIFLFLLNTDPLQSFQVLNHLCLPLFPPRYLLYYLGGYLIFNNQHLVICGAYDFLILFQWGLLAFGIIFFLLGYKIFDKQKCYWQADCSLGDAQLCICTIKVEAWWSPCLYSGGTARTRVYIIASGTQSQIRHLCDFLMAGDVYLPTVSISRCIQAGCQSQGPENL